MRAQERRWGSCRLAWPTFKGDRDYLNGRCSAQMTPPYVPCRSASMSKASNQIEILITREQGNSTFRFIQSPSACYTADNERVSLQLHCASSHTKLTNCNVSAVKEEGRESAKNIWWGAIHASFCTVETSRPLSWLMLWSTLHRCPRPRQSGSECETPRGTPTFSPGGNSLRKSEALLSPRKTRRPIRN